MRYFPMATGFDLVIAGGKPGRTPWRALGMGSALLALTACGGGDKLDWDLRNPNSSLNTTQAALDAAGSRPSPDGRGVISYPGYQVAVARRGDTVGSVAARVGLDAGELAKYNALQPQDTLRAGEVLSLPRRVGGTASGAITGAPIQTQAIDVTSLASGAIDRASGNSAGTAAPGWQTGAQPVRTAPGVEPVRHKVARGETAFTIARTYNVSARALADWNGLGADMNVREGQYLLIPVPTAGATPAPDAVVTQPGAGSPTPVPPSASKPLPAQDEPPANTAARATPASPTLNTQRSAASAARYGMPVNGAIIRGYAKGKNEGIDIAAPAGTPVLAATDGSVAVITKDTNQVLTLVIKNADGLLTVYAGIEGATVAKGDKVKRGQPVAKVRNANPSFLHFEVRQGMDSQDPMRFLQ